jgi:hypothetical protein
MMENWSRALSRATGEYVCIIGDDDGINPEILQAAQWAKRNAYDGLAVSVDVTYLWTNSGAPQTLYTKLFHKPLDGFLSIPFFRGYVKPKVHIEEELRKFVRSGGVYFQDFDLPKVYHGFIHRRCLEMVREKLGTYCTGLSPDMFLAIAVACTNPRIAMTDYPLTIPGACRASNSVIQGMLKCQSKKLEDQPEFQNRHYPWSDVVPRVFTVPPIWADSAVSALRSMGRTDLVQLLNLPRLAALCVRENHGVAQLAYQDMRTSLQKTGKSVTLGAIAFAWYVLWLKVGKQVGWLNRIMRRVGFRRIYRVDGINNMEEASRSLTRYLDEHGQSFAQSLRKYAKNAAFID